VTLALLGMHEAGYMEDLDNKWIFLDEQICEEKGENFPATLGLKNMAGVLFWLALEFLVESVLLCLKYSIRNITRRNRKGWNWPEMQSTNGKK